MQAGVNTRRRSFKVDVCLWKRASAISKHVSCHAGCTLSRGQNYVLTFCRPFVSLASLSKPRRSWPCWSRGPRGRPGPVPPPGSCRLWAAQSPAWAAAACNPAPGARGNPFPPFCMRGQLRCGLPAAITSCYGSRRNFRTSGDPGRSSRLPQKRAHSPSEGGPHVSKQKAKT